MDVRVVKGVLCLNWHLGRRLCLKTHFCSPREYFLNLFGSDCHLYAWCVHMSGVGERDSLQCCNSDAVWFQVTWRAWPPGYRRISWPWRVKRRLGHILCHGWKLVPILDREHLLQHCIIMSLFERLLLTFDIHCTLYALSCLQTDYLAVECWYAKFTFSFTK